MQKRLAIIGAVAALAAGAAWVAPAHAAVGSVVPPGNITVSVVTVNGSGCPAGTAAVAPSPDNTAFTVTYSQFQVKPGGTNIRQNCQLVLSVHYPQGFTYAVAEADYRGFANLSKGASGQEQANYYFQGQAATASSRHIWSGPMQDDWQATDMADSASLIYSPCGVTRYLNVNSSLLLSNGKSGDFMEMDSTDGSFSTIFHLSWRTC